jgi:hypothetical protein
MDFCSAPAGAQLDCRVVAALLFAMTGEASASRGPLCLSDRPARLRIFWVSSEFRERRNVSSFMTRFYFDLKYDGEDPIHTEDGRDLPDPEAAGLFAASILTDLSRATLRSGKAPGALAVIVRDDNEPVLQATLVVEMKRLD